MIKPAKLRAPWRGGFPSVVYFIFQDEEWTKKGQCLVMAHYKQQLGQGSHNCERESVREPLPKPPVMSIQAIPIFNQLHSSTNTSAYLRVPPPFRRNQKRLARYLAAERQSPRSRFSSTRQAPPTVAPPSPSQATEEANRRLCGSKEPALRGAGHVGGAEGRPHFGGGSGGQTVTCEVGWRLGEVVGCEWDGREWDGSCNMWV